MLSSRSKGDSSMASLSRYFNGPPTATMDLVRGKEGYVGEVHRKQEIWLAEPPAR